MERKFKGFVSLVVLLAFVGAIVLVVGCGKKEPEVYKIGAVLPLTGKLAMFGEGERNALLLAQEKINAAGGINGHKIQFILEDSKAEPKEAVSIVNKLIDVDKVKIIFLFKSTLIHAVQPITTKAKVLMLAFAMDPGIVAKSPYTFRIYPNMQQQNEVMLDYLRNSSAKRVAVFYISTPATESLIPNYLKPGLEKIGKELVAAESFTKEDRDLRPQALKIKAADAEVVISLAHPAFIPLILKALSGVGLLGKVEILGGLSYTFELKVSNEFLEGIRFISPVYDLEKPGEERILTEFEKDYQAKYGKRPGYDPAFFFDAAMVIAKGIEENGYDVEKLRDFLSNLKGYKGVSGEITILPSGDAEVAMEVGIFKNGKRMLYER